MNIAFTFPIFNQKVGGVSRYFFEIAEHFKYNHNLFFVSRNSVNEYYDKALFPKKPFIKRVNFPGKSRLLEQLQLRYSEKKFKNNEFDLIHHTGEFSEIFDFNINNKPIVITIHDMIPELFYSSVTDRIENRKICIEKSTAIICVSENTKSDLIKFFPKLDKSKIFVIYHGHDNRQYNYQIKDDKLYILYVGSRYSYKNFLFFLSSIALILKERGMYLYCTGEPFTSEEIKLINKLDLNYSILNKGIVSDDELANLYHSAACFVYPSLYEGFGIPILEAFKHNCPVVLSNTSCFPEIASDSAVYFDPNNSKSIQNSIINAIENREELIKLGSNRLLEFSWKKAAEKTEYVYTWAIENHNK